MIDTSDNISGAYASGAAIDALATIVSTNQTNKTSQEISNQNIAFQERENAITRMREDNAYERAAASLERAGLSKTLAAGNPASSAALTAPKADYQNESAIGRALERINFKDAILALDSHKSEIAERAAQTNKLKAETASIDLANSVYLQKFANEQQLTLAQVDYTKAQLKKADAEARLTSIEANFRPEILQNQIQSEISKRANLNMSTEKLVQDISESIARQNKLSYEQQFLVKDIVKADLQISELEHNIEYARKYNLPVGAMLNGEIGSYGNLFRSFGNNAGFSFSADYTPSQDEVKEVLDYMDESSKKYSSGYYNGGYAW